MGVDNTRPLLDGSRQFRMGKGRLNSRLLFLCGTHGVRISVFDYYGYFKGAFEPVDQNPSGRVKLEQARSILDEAERLSIAREIVRGAAHNFRAHLGKLPDFVFEPDGLYGGAARGVQDPSGPEPELAAFAVFRAGFVEFGFGGAVQAGAGGRADFPDGAAADGEGQLVRRAGRGLSADGCGAAARGGAVFHTAGGAGSGPELPGMDVSGGAESGASGDGRGGIRGVSAEDLECTF